MGQSRVVRCFNAQLTEKMIYSDEANALCLYPEIFSDFLSSRCSSNRTSFILQGLKVESLSTIWTDNSDANH